MTGEVTSGFNLCEFAIQADELLGGSGDDIIGDFCGDNLADGGQGRDNVQVTGTAKGGSGDDINITAVGGDFAACAGCWEGRAFGGSGSDQVRVTGGVAEGGSGNDDLGTVLEGDELRGGAGNDVLISTVGGGTLKGGSGYDSCVLFGSPDTLISCEDVVP